MFSGARAEEDISRISKRVRKALGGIVEKEWKKADREGVQELDFHIGVLAGLLFEGAVHACTMVGIQRGIDRPSNQQDVAMAQRIYHGFTKAAEYVLRVELGQAEGTEDFPWPSGRIGRA